MKDQIRRMAVKLKNRLLGGFQGLRSWMRLFNKTLLGEVYSIDYLNQFGSRENVREVLDRKIRPSVNFAEWRSFGAETAEEFDELAYEICGMTCLSMVLRHFRAAKTGPVELFKRSLKYGCYIVPPGEGEIRGLFHVPFVKFLDEEFGLKGRPMQYVGPYVIADEIARGNLVIVSVNWEIREPVPRPKRRGGHLVLVTGATKDAWYLKGFAIHNPSGTKPENQSHHFVCLKNFQKCFSGNIISISRPT